MNDKLIELLEKLAVMWPMLVAKTRFDYLADAIVCVLSLFIGTIGLVLSLKALKKADDDHADILPCIATAVTGILFIIGIIGTLMAIANIGTFIYPEAATIQRLLAQS